MGFLSNIGGMLPDAYIGYNRGVDDEVARQERTKLIGDRDEARAAAKAVAPLKQEAERLRLENDVGDAKTAATMAPQRREMEVASQQAKSDLLPGQIKLAKGEQGAAIDKLLVNQVQAVVEGAKTGQQAQEYFNATVGEALQRGDMASVNRVFGHMVDAPIFPGLNGMEKPVSSRMVTAPAGAVDFTGQPVQGQAVEMKMPDGSTKFATTRYFSDAYAKMLETQRQARLKIVKPGEQLVDTATGKSVFQAEAAAPSGWVRDENGELIYMGGARGGAGGMGGGSGGAGKGGGKAPSAPIEEASKLLSDALEKAGEKAATPQAYTLAQSYLDGVYKTNPSISPRTAAAIAADAAADPTKLSLQVNPRDGSVNQVYVNPRFDGGKPFNLGANGGSVAEMEKQVGGPTKMREAVGQMMAGQKDDATRAAITRAAKEPAYLLQVQEQIRAGSTPEGLEQNLAAFNNKVNLLRSYAVPEKAKATAGGSVFGGVKVGGLFPPSGYTPDPTSPAGKAAAARASQQERAGAKDQAKNEGQQKLSQQFQSDLKTMQPLELARKYDEVRSQLPATDAAALQAAEKQIR